MEYVICFNFQRVKSTLVCIDEQSFTDIFRLGPSMFHGQFPYFNSYSYHQLTHLKCEICRMHDLQRVNTPQIMQHMAKDSFYFLGV